MTAQTHSEIVVVRTTSFLAYPRGRHQALRSLPFAATVCVPVWNDGSLLARALASLAGQTWRDFAVLIVDNGSSDESHAIACAFADENENVVVYQCAQSVGRTRLWNHCLDLAFGEYVKLLEAWDYLLPTFMAAAVEAFQSDAEIDLVRVGSAAMRDQRLVALAAFSSSRQMTGPSALVQTLTTTNVVGSASSHLVRRSALNLQHLRYRIDLSFGAATELALQLFLTGDFAYVHEPLVVLDEGTERQPGARVCFRDECEARVSGVQAAQSMLMPRTMIGTINLLTCLFEQYLPRAEDEGQATELERDYAHALASLSLVLKNAVSTGGHGSPITENQIRDMLKAAEAESRARHYAQAEAQLRDVLAIAPCSSLALGYLARVCFAKLEVNRARKYFLSALALDPSLELSPAEVDALGA